MKYSNLIKVGLTIAITGLMFALSACGVFQKSTNESLEKHVEKPEKIEKPGAVLWGENCTRCHNAPNAGAFTEKQWEVIGKHMRIRANLTADESEKIVEFLMQAN